MASRRKYHCARLDQMAKERTPVSRRKREHIEAHAFVVMPYRPLPLAHKPLLLHLQPVKKHDPPFFTTCLLTTDPKNIFEFSQKAPLASNLNVKN
jgi:hypothetical protein